MLRMICDGTRWRVAAVAVALLLCAGCFHTLGGRSAEPSVEQLGKLQRAKTPTDVEALFGAPTQVLRPAQDRLVLVYDYPIAGDEGHVLRYRFEFKDGTRSNLTIERVERAAQPDDGLP